MSDTRPGDRRERLCRQPSRRASVLVARPGRRGRRPVELPLGVADRRSARSRSRPRGDSRASTGADLPLRRRAARRRVLARHGAAARRQRAGDASPARRGASRGSPLPRARARIGNRLRAVVRAHHRKRRHRAGKPVRPQQARAGAAGAARDAGGRPRRGRDAFVQSHRAAADSGVCRTQHGAADRLDRARTARAGDQGRQPRRAPRPHGRPRCGPRVCRAHEVRHGRRRLQRGLGRRSLHPIGPGGAGLAIARSRPDRNRPGSHAAERRAVLVGDFSPPHATPPVGGPTVSFDQMLDDLLDYWRAASRSGRRRSPYTSLLRSATLMANIRRSHVGFAMEIAPLLFDLGRSQAHHAPGRRPGQSRRRRGPDRGDSPRRRRALPGSPVPLGAERGQGDAVLQVDVESLPRLHARLPLLLRAPLPRAVRAGRRR